MRLHALTTLALLTGLISLGCQPAGQDSMDLLDTNVSSIKIDDLSRTMDFVLSEKRFQQKEFVEKVASGLNRWVRANPDRFADASFSPDEMAMPLLEKYKDLALIGESEKMSFLNSDAHYLQQSAWIDKVSKRIANSSSLSQLEFYRLAAGGIESDSDDSDPMGRVVKELHPDLDEKSSQQLATGIKLFDWVIRNIQLLPEPEIAPEKLDELRLENNPSDDLAWSGVQGLGYVRTARQTLLYSRGDYVERAKLFMLMADNVGIDAVMLAVDQAGEEKLWCAALLIEGELYLFDTKLGLPVPGEKLGSVATLKNVKANPQLLDQLDLSVDESLADDTKYWVKAPDLSEVTALIYVAPEGTSLRIAQLESNLTAEYRLPLTSKPSVLVDKLKDVDGVTAKVWDIDFRNNAFRNAVKYAITQTQNETVQSKLVWHFLNEAYIDEFPAYRTARSMYFNGNFESERNAVRSNAIQRFFALMYDDETIKSLGTDEFLQRRLGISKDSGTAVVEFQRNLKNVQGQMQLVRRDAGFFLALCHFDNGNTGTAAKWLERIQDKADIEGADRWKDGVSNLLARAYESRKEYDRAIDVYRQEKESTQVHGNLIRARLLSKLIADLDQQ